MGTRQARGPQERRTVGRIERPGGGDGGEPAPEPTRSAEISPTAWPLHVVPIFAGVPVVGAARYACLTSQYCPFELCTTWPLVFIYGMYSDPSRFEGRDITLSFRKADHRCAAGARGEIECRVHLRNC